MEYALVVPGGLMLCVFQLGVLLGWREEGIGAGFFAKSFGSSGGAYNIAYNSADQIGEEGVRLWAEHVPNGFLRPALQGMRADFRYLDALIRYIEYLDIDRLRQGQKIYAAISNARTLKAEYVCLNDAPDPALVLLAGAAMPYFTRPIRIAGVPYYDGALTAPIPITSPDINDGDRVIVLATVPAGNHYREAAFWKIASLLRTSKSERLLLRRRPEHERAIWQIIEKRPNTVVIYPPADLPVGWMSKDRVAIAKAIAIGKEIGRRSVVRLTEQ